MSSISGKRVLAPIFLLPVFAAVAVLALSGGAAAQAGWQAEWQKTLAAAEKEGKVVLLVPPSRTQRAFLQREWPKAFPNIKLSITTMSGWKWLQRVKTERGGGKYLWDGALSGAVLGFNTANAGLLDPLRPEFIYPDVKDPRTWGGWDAAFFDKGKEYVLTTRSFLKMPFFNADLLPPEKVKRLGKKVFLDPSLKGKIIWHDPLISGSGQSFAVIMRRLLGDADLKKFVTEQVVFTPSMNNLVERMARSQYAIGFGPVMTNLLKRYKKAGVKFDIRPLGNTPELAAYGNTGGSSLFILKNRPHPNAMRVFINWYLSKPVAQRLAKVMGEDSRRTDIPEQVGAARMRVKGVEYFEPQREDAWAELRRAHAFIKKARGR